MLFSILAVLSDHTQTVLAALALQLVQLILSSYNARKSSVIRTEQKTIKAALKSAVSPAGGNGGEK
jgi:hypothetical protein